MIIPIHNAMTYKIQITETAKSEIRKKLGEHLIYRLDKRIRKLRESPKIYGKPLRYPLAGIWELYFEKCYRVLYKIDEEDKIVYIVGLKHKDEMRKLIGI